MKNCLNEMLLIDMYNAHIQYQYYFYYILYPNWQNVNNYIFSIKYIVNIYFKNAIPNDPEKPFVTSGIRVGTPAVTTRGFKEPEMVKIAQWMGRVARDFESCKDQVRAEVDALCKQFPIY